MKIVFDASSLISVSQTCLVNILPLIGEKTGAEFVIPKTVFYEAVERPIAIKRFELNAIRIKKAIGDGGFKVVGARDKALLRKISDAANNCFFIKGRAITLLQKGEIEALALIKELGAGGLAIDERTTRMLIESPGQLLRILEARRHASIEEDRRNSDVLGEMFQGLAIVRSVELIALAYELGLLQKELPKGEQSLEAALFAAKYSGCAVSSREIKMFLQGMR